MIPVFAWRAEADTVPAAVATGAGELGRLPFPRFMEMWHDFYLLTGTASVTLAGLLFVALSLHLEQLVEESHEHLLALSRAMLMSFLMVLIGSLMMLAPGLSRRVTGFSLVAIAATGAVLTLRLMGSVRHHEEGGFSEANMRRRKLLPMIGYGFVVLSGVGIVLGNQDLMNGTVGGFALLLANATATSFELLVHVARHKKHARAARDA